MTARSLSESLADVLSGDHPEGITIGEILDNVGEKGFGLLLVVLSLPSALPVPAAGYSTPFGIALFILGMQMLMGRRVPALPGWIRRRRIPKRLGGAMMGFAVKVTSKLERFIRPRFQWVGSRWAMAGMSLLVLAMAALMTLPIPGTNTIPAGAIFLIGIGLTEKDGVFVALALLVGVLSVGVYAVALYAVFFLGAAGIEGGIEWVKELVRGGA